MYISFDFVHDPMFLNSYRHIHRNLFGGYQARMSAEVPAFQLKFHVVRLGECMLGPINRIRPTSSNPRVQNIYDYFAFSFDGKSILQLKQCL
jgi:hypothetical protein